MKITLRDKEDRRKEIPIRENQTVLEALQKADIYIPALCAGRGTCGKCKIRILEGQVTETRFDTDQEQGRLACKTCALTDIVVELEKGDEQEIVVEGVKASAKSHSAYGEHYFIAVDIGTTTIAMALVVEESGETRTTHAALNRQRMHGADVISRIAAANNGHLEELHRLITEDLWQGIGLLTENGRIPISKVVIAANTTMVHLLMGYSCESLGRHPFFSEHLGLLNTTLGEIMADITAAKKDKSAIAGYDETEAESRLGVPLVVLPGISAFVGSDITADLLICPGFREEGVSLLLDMGTNGEMVIGNGNRLIASSTAAGPAFEGGNITCGIGSIPGAINQVKIMNRRAVIGTIGGKQSATGICGTGIIAGMAELKRNRLMNPEGTLQPPYDKTGYPLWSSPRGEKIAIYQQDIRQLQLAKGAIRAGMEQLMEAYGCKPNEVDRVYLAGGFGTKLPIQEAIEIGLFPKEFTGKIIAIGNGALQGAIAYGRKEEALTGNKQLEEILKRVEGLNLALAEGFEERYLKYLDF
ncbi:MAG: ASKHA domain-containing protein [Lachnospiraceae bacterium]